MKKWVLIYTRSCLASPWINSSFLASLADTFTPFGYIHLDWKCSKFQYIKLSRKKLNPCKLTPSLDSWEAMRFLRVLRMCFKCDFFGTSSLDRFEITKFRSICEFNCWICNCKSEFSFCKFATVPFNFFFFVFNCSIKNYFNIYIIFNYETMIIYLCDLLIFPFQLDFEFIGVLWFKIVGCLKWENGNWIIEIILLMRALNIKYFGCLVIPFRQSCLRTLQVYHRIFHCRYWRC